MPSFHIRQARRAILRSLVAVLALAAAAVLPSAARANSPRVDARERAVIDRVNDVRADYGLAPLQLGRRLSRAADRHSRRMARARVLTHQLAGEAALASRTRWATGDATVGETIFWGSGGVRSAEIVRAWMDSPGHRELLLSREFDVAGIGIRSGRGGLYATVDLASS